MRNNPTALDFLKIATQTAHFFGFDNVDNLRVPELEPDAVKVTHSATANDRRTDALHGLLTSGICTYLDNRLYKKDSPALFYTTNTVPRTGETAISLQVLNVEKSIGEAILIQTIRAMLDDLGFPNSSVRINSLGDQESITRYIRELTNFFRKRIDDMPAPARELMKEHVFTALMYLVEKQHELALRSPSPLEYLSDPSRKHFREIIEYLDMSQIAYEIDSKLLGNHQCYSDAIFSIEVNDTETSALEEQPILVRGGRYNTFVSRMTKEHIPAVGAVVVLRDKKAPKEIPKMRKRPIPSVFVVQLGFGPKIRSLLLVNELKQAGIPVLQDIVSDSLSAQLLKAEEKNVHYAIILGQKEFVDGNVILRDLHARSQENIPVGLLVNHLRKVI